jgi:hypothetical protein
MKDAQEPGEIRTFIRRLGHRKHPRPTKRMTVSSTRTPRVTRGSRSRAEPQGSMKVWRLGRILEANSSTLLFLGITLAVFVSRKFLILPIASAAMAAQEALQASVRQAQFRRGRSVSLRRT